MMRKVDKPKKIIPIHETKSIILNILHITEIHHVSLFVAYSRIAVFHSKIEYSQCYYS